MNSKITTKCEEEQNKEVFNMIPVHEKKIMSMELIETFSDG